MREAPAHFTRGGKQYLLTSGTTGYLPNPSQAAVAESWHGAYTVLGDPHRNDESHTSYHSQISSVYKVPGKKDLYIALADRWLPEHSYITYEQTKAQFISWFSPEHPAYTDTGISRLVQNTSIADYVWLPLVFEDGKVYIDWRDDWRIEDYT